MSYEIFVFLVFYMLYFTVIRLIVNLLSLLSPILKPPPSNAHVVASAATTNLQTPAREKDL